MSSKKDGPDAPDYTAAAEKQAQSSREITDAQTWANRPTQNTPWGTSKWSSSAAVDPATGKPITSWQQDITLDPDSQAALDAQQRIDAGKSGIAEGMLGRSADEFSSKVDFSGMPAAGKSSGAFSLNPYDQGNQTSDIYYGDAHKVGDPTAYRDKAEGAVYDREASRLDPQWQQNESNLDVDLRSKGLTPGTEAYDRAYGNMSRAKNDAYAGARNDAITMGGAEADRMFGQDVQRRGIDTGETNARYNARVGDRDFQNQLRGQQFNEQLAGSGHDSTLRQQGIAEELQKRGWSLNEINSILTGTQVQNPNMPSFSNAARPDVPNYMGAAQNQYQAGMDKSNFKQAGWQGIMSGIGMIPGLL